MEDARGVGHAGAHGPRADAKARSQSIASARTHTPAQLAMSSSVFWADRRRQRRARMAQEKGSPRPARLRPRLATDDVAPFSPPRVALRKKGQSVFAPLPPLMEKREIHTEKRKKENRECAHRRKRPHRETRKKKKMRDRKKNKKVSRKEGLTGGRGRTDDRLFFTLFSHGRGPCRFASCARCRSPPICALLYFFTFVAAVAATGLQCACEAKRDRFVALFFPGQRRVRTRRGAGHRRSARRRDAPPRAPT